MNPLTTHFYRDAEPWLELLELLENAKTELPTVTWRPSIPGIDPSKPDSITKIRKALRDGQRECGQGLVTAIVARVQGKGWSGIGEKESFFLRLAVTQAIDFVGRLLVDEGESRKTIFAYPSENHGEVLLWLLTDWWDGDGIHRVTYEAFREIADASRRFEPGVN